MADVDEVIYKADQFIENCEFEEACNLLRQHTNPPRYEILRLLANALYSLFREWCRTEKKRAEELILEGYDISSKLLQISPNASSSHKYYAMFLGEKAGISGPKQQIMSLTVVLSHIKTARQLDPLDPFVWYLEGAFYEKLTCLQWFEKQFVYTLVNDLVRPTHDDVLRCLLKAEEIKANFFHYNQLLIGKVYFSRKEFDKARSYLQTLANLRILRTDDDKRAKEEAVKLLARM